VHLDGNRADEVVLVGVDRGKCTRGGDTAEGQEIEWRHCLVHELLQRHRHKRVSGRQVPVKIRENKNWVSLAVKKG